MNLPLIYMRLTIMQVTKHSDISLYPDTFANY